MADSTHPSPQSSWTIASAERELQSSSATAVPFLGGLKRSNVTRYELECKGDQGETYGRDRKEEQKGKEKWVRKRENGREKGRRKRKAGERGRQWEKEERVRLAASNKCCQ